MPARLTRSHLVAGLVFVLLPGLALAQQSESWPLHANTYVNDYADLLPEDVEGRITRSLEVLREETGVEATVLTLPTRRGYTPSPTMEDFATGLFNHWGIGDAARDDGVLVMVLSDDREMRIELGAGYPPAFDDEAQDIIDRVFLPAFSDGDFAEGIEDGTDAVTRRIARVHAGGDAPEFARDGADEDGVLGWVLGTLVVIGSLVAVFWRRIRDRLSRCPDCGERGLHSRRVTQRRATRNATGHGETLIDCPHCGYHAVRSFTIPRVTSSSSSSGGSFGGGSSSGGGASGRW